MLAAITGFFTAFNTLVAGIQSLTAAIEKWSAEMEAQRISKASSDMAAAQTPAEIKKAVDEAASAINHLG